MEIGAFLSPSLRKTQRSQPIVVLGRRIRAMLNEEARKSHTVAFRCYYQMQRSRPSLS